MPDLRQRDRRILEAIYNYGREANTTEIKEFTGIEKNGIIRHAIAGEGKLADQGLVDWENRETAEHPNGIRVTSLTPAGVKVCERLYDDDDGGNVPLTDEIEQLRRDVREYREDVDEFLTMASDANMDAEDARREAKRARENAVEARERLDTLAEGVEEDVEEAIDTAKAAEYVAEEAVDKAERALETQRENEALRSRLDAVDDVVGDLRELGLVEGDVESGLDRGPFLRRVEEDVRPGLMDRLEQLNDAGAFEPFRNLDEEAARNLAAVAEHLDLDTLNQGLLEQHRIEERRGMSAEDLHLGPLIDALAEFGGVATESELARRLYTSEAEVRRFVEASRSSKLLAEETEEGRVYTHEWVDHLLEAGGSATVEELAKLTYDGLTETAAKSHLLNVGGREGLLGPTLARVEETEDGTTEFHVHPHTRYWLRPGFEPPEEGVEEAEEKAEEKATGGGIFGWSR